MKKIFTLLLSLLLTLCVQAQINVSPSVKVAENRAGDASLVYGLLRYSNAESIQYGMMEIGTTLGSGTKLVWNDSDMVLTGTGGAVYVNGELYVLSFMDFGGILAATYVKAHPEKHTYQSVGDEMIMIDYSYIATDLTYDATTGNVYAVSLNGSGDGTFVLSTMNLQTAAKSPIGSIPHMCGLAADAQGQLWAIDMQGRLCKINKETADVSVVGATGVVPTADCSATFDLVSGQLYWSAYTATGGGLYSINIETGEATLVNAYPNGEQITGIFMKEPEKSSATPAMVEYTAMQFEKASLSGTISFEMPLLDITGQPLTTKMTWKVNMGNEELAAGEAMPGDVVDVKVVVPVDDKYHFTIRVANEAGVSEPLHLERFIGLDTPQKPTNVKLVTDQGRMQLTWDTPQVGVNGGYLDLNQLSHQIVRLPDGVLVADGLVGNSFSEELPVEGIKAYYYQIKPRMNDYVGESEYSNVDTVGHCMIVPFREDFTDVMRYILYTSVDANGDECYWTWTVLPEEATHMPCATYMWGIAPENNDWLISPAIRFEKGKEYSAAYKVRGEADSYAGNLNVYLGTSPQTAEMKTPLMEEATIDFANDSLLVTRKFTVEETGNYYLGMHVGGVRSHFYIYLTSLEINEATTAVQGVQSQSSANVFVQGNQVVVNNPLGEMITIYGTDGRLYSKSVNSYFSTELPSGVYLVKVGKTIRKVMIK